MTPVFATRLSIVPDHTHDADQIFPAAIAVCKAWLQEKANELNLEIELDDHSSVRTGTDEASRITWYDLAGVEEQGWQAMLTQPLEGKSDPSGRFTLRIEVSVRTSADELSITIRGMLNSRFDRIRPPAFVMRPPRLIRMLVDTFDNIAANSTKVTYKPKFLLESEVGELIDHILDYNRMAPVVVVSKTEDGRVLCEPNLLAGALAGLGRVYVLPSSAASFRLTDALTKSLSAYNGAVRLYWPEISIRDDRYAHPLWLGEVLGFPGASTRLVNDILLQVTSASAIGVAADRQVLEMEQALLAQRTEEAQQRLKAAQLRTRELEDSRSSEEQVIVALRNELLEYESLLDIAEREKSVAEMQTQEAHQRQNSLIQDGFAKDARISSLLAQSSSHQDPIPLFEEYESAKNLGGYLELARKIAPEQAIMFLDSCDVSASKSPMVGNMKGCWKALSAVIQGAIEFHNDPSAQLQETMMTRVGLTTDQFKTDVSDSARGRYSSDYTIRYTNSKGNQAVSQLGPHIGLGVGNKDKHPFVYWYVDMETRQFVVGHVGAKLRDSTGGYAR